MLVLTRLRDESALVGREVLVTVRDMRPDAVRMEVIAPLGMDVVHSRSGAVSRDGAVTTVLEGRSVIRWSVDVPENEHVRIGDGIVVTVARIVINHVGQPVRVRLGFQAPPELRICRQEGELTFTPPVPPKPPA